jgi:hypothetical protein
LAPHLRIEFACVRRREVPRTGCPYWSSSPARVFNDSAGTLTMEMVVALRLRADTGGQL